MRYRIRLTRALALIFVFCLVLFLCASDKLPTIDHILSFKSRSLYHRPTAKAINSAFFDSIQSFWRKWSTIFRDGHPRIERIILSSDALLSGISDEDYGLREPSENRVANSDSDIEAMHSSHAVLLEKLHTENVGGDMFHGTGVVIMGGGEYFGPALIGLHMLRKTGSTLPVEVFVANADEYEPTLCEDYLPKFGARCLVLTYFLEESRNTSQSFKVTHYQLKSLAMLFSSFAEVLYLDSDSIPLVDPSTELFSTEPYKSSGLVVWPDFWQATESPLFYEIAGLPSFPSDLPESSSEAGQLLINKRTHLKTLLLATYYNIYGPDHYYPLLSQGVLGQGDKETFMAAALVCGEPFYRVRTSVVAVGRHNGDEFKGSGMVQHMPSDDLLRATTSSEDKHSVRPAFLHANTPKMNAGHLVDEGDLFAVDQKRLRLWGSGEDQEKRFGYDVERSVWKLLLKLGCELEHVIGEWKHRGRMCARLEEHWKEVF